MPSNHLLNFFLLGFPASKGFVLAKLCMRPEVSQLGTFRFPGAICDGNQPGDASMQNWPMLMVLLLHSIRADGAFKSWELERMFDAFPVFGSGENPSRISYTR